MKEITFHCDRCNKTIRHEVSLGVGYGVADDGKKYCYNCCADRDNEQMVQTGKICLYLTNTDKPIWRVTNWPGTLSFRELRSNIGEHNFADHRYDIWFVGPDEHIWHGVTYGDNTQVCHCKRTKNKIGG